jgi:archaetidylinositol phosphate synthase
LELTVDLYLLKFPYRKILTPLAKKLRWLDPDIVSYAAVVVAAGTGWCFYKAAESPNLLLIAIFLTLLRMTLNTIDGVMAIQRGKHTLTGEIVNALPDRYSDIFVVGGIALSSLCRDWLGLVALATVFLVSYTGMLGKAIGVAWQHQGPMGKVERLITIMVFALFQFFLLPEPQFVTIAGITVTPMEMAMGLFVVLGQYSVLRRLKGQIREINHKEEERGQAIGARAVVIYDSSTGNTRQVAIEIAKGIGCTAKQVSEVDDIKDYHLVVLGSPNWRKCPTKAMQKFQDAISARPPFLAAFATFGLPVWGHLTTPVCLRYMARKWNMKAVAQFICPGYHQKYKTYKGRPRQKDLKKAYRFGLKLARKLDQEQMRQSR